MFERLGRLVYRRRRWVVALSVAIVAFAGAWGTGVFGQMTGGGFDDPASESSRAAVLAVQELGRDTADVVVLYRSDDLTVDDPAYRDAVTGSRTALPGGLVERATTWFDTGAAPRVSEDRRSTYAVLQLAGDADAREDALEVVEDRLSAPGLQTSIGGTTTVDRDINERVGDDIARAEMISLPVLAVLLVIVFGSLAAASLPLVIGVTAILGAFAALRLVSGFTDV